MQQLIPEMLLSILILKCVLSFTFPCTQTRGKSPSTMNLGTTLRYLEHNCWEIMLNNATIYIDPIMSQLNFGVPILYRGDKKVIDGRRELLKLASTANVILISQGFGDHAHAPTLRTLISLNKKLSFICPLSALSILTACGVPDVNIQVLKPSQSTLAMVLSK